MRYWELVIHLCGFTMGVPSEFSAPSHAFELQEMFDDLKNKRPP